MTGTTILAIDLGKYKCVACVYDRAMTATEYRTITTSRAEVERLVRAARPAVVVIEACSPAGWVHDLCGEIGVPCRVAAQAVGRTQSPLGLFYRRIKGRIGGQGAVTASAHKLARLVYRMLKFGAEYVRRSMAEYETKLRAMLERQLRAKAARMGFELLPRCQTASP